MLCLRPRNHRHSAIARLRLLPGALVCLLFFAPVAAQQSQDSVRSWTQQGTQKAITSGFLGDRVHLSLLSGVTANSSLHGSIGAAAGLWLGQWGIAALGAIGRGGGYDSVLLGAGATRQIVSERTVAVRALLGVGHYQEEASVVGERQAPGVFLGALASKNVGRVSFTLAATEMVGRYAEDDVPNPFVFHVLRIWLGVGL